MFGIGGFELFLILIFGFLIFGPDKLPEMAKTVGKGINKFRSAQEEMNKVIKTEVYDPNSDEPFKDPLSALEKIGDGGTKAVEKLTEASKEEEADKDKPSAARPKAETSAESFSERKARYERERAEKKAAEAEAKAEAEKAAKEAAKEEAAKKAAERAAESKAAAES